MRIHTAIITGRPLESDGTLHWNGPITATLLADADAFGGAFHATIDVTAHRPHDLMADWQFASDLQVVLGADLAPFGVEVAAPMSNLAANEDGTSSVAVELVPTAAAWNDAVNEAIETAPEHVRHALDPNDADRVWLWVIDAHTHETSGQREVLFAGDGIPMPGTCAAYRIFNDQTSCVHEAWCTHVDREDGVDALTSAFERAGAEPNPVGVDPGGVDDEAQNEDVDVLT